MATYLVTDPQSGRKLRLTGDAPPTEQELEEVFASMGQPEPSKPEPPEGSIVDAIGRGAGLATRNVIEGAGAIPIALTDAAGRLVFGDDYRPVSQTLTDLGLPEPETAGERMVSAAGEGAAAAASGIGLGRVLMGTRGAGTRATGDLLAAAPAAQLAGGAGAGVSAQVAEEAGAGPVGQTVAGLAGGTVAGMAAMPRTVHAPGQRLVEPGRRVDPSTPMASPPSGAATTARDADLIRSRSTRIEPIVQRAAADIGVDWASLDDAVRERAIHIAERAMQTSDLPPEAAVRTAFYESLGLKPTRGMATRNLVDTQAEGVLKRRGTEEGAALRDIDASNNAAFRQKIRELAPAGVDDVDASTFGQRFRAPLVEGERRAQQVTNRAYQQAMEAEGGRAAPVDHLNQFLTDNADILNSRPASAGLVDDLQKIGLLRDDWRAPGSEPFKLGDLSDKPSRFTLRDLASARAAVNEAWDTAKRTGDTRAANRLSEMRRIMDDVEAEAGGELFKAYRKLRVKKGDRYEDNPLIDRLLKDQRGYYGTAQIEDSQVFDKAVLGSTVEQFYKAWPRLTPKAQDLTRAQVAKYIEERTFSNMAMNERADPVASAAKLTQAISSIHPMKLRAIYGADKAKDLANLNRALKEIANPPAGSVPTGSAPMISQLFDSTLNLLGRIPAVGGATSDGLRAAFRLVRSGGEARRNKEAVDTAVNFIPGAPAPKPADRLREAAISAALPASAASQAVAGESTSMAPHDAAAHEAATSPHNELPEPTDSQKRAGNYRKGHLRIQGLDVSIENPAGSERRGTDPDGKSWKRQVGAHYGYIRKTTGADDEQIDAFIGDDPGSVRVWVIDQIDQENGAFDETKVLLGFSNRVKAVNAYKNSYPKGWKVGTVSEMTIDQLKEWLQGDTTKSFSGAAEARK